MEKHELRPYQVKAKESVLRELIGGCSKQLLVMATGTGKTKTAIETIKDVPGKLNWITHTEELIEQSAKAYIKDAAPEYYQEIATFIDNKDGLPEALKEANEMKLLSTDGIKWFAENIGVIKASNMYTDAPIIFSSAQTLWRRLDKLPEDMFDVIICDEAHIFGANTFVKSLEHFKPKLRLGLTATPKRQDGMMMGDIFDKIVYQYNIADGIKEGFLCQIDAIRIKTTLNLDTVRTTAGELNQKDLSNTVDIPERNALIVEKWKQYALNRPTIVFGLDIEHCKNIHKAFRDQGISSDIVVGDETVTRDRKGSIEKFKNGETTVLINCMILTAGFDHPETACIIMACPTKSETKYLQQLGRGTRLKKGFKDCIILDIVDATSRHRLVNTYTLDKDKPFEDKVFMTDQKREEFIAKRNKVKLEVKRDSDERVDLIPLPKIHQSNSIRMQEPATEKQLSWIAQWGYDIINVNYTKKMCSDIISNQTASPAQVWALKKAGYDVSTGVTIAEAKAAFDQIDNKKEQETKLLLKKQATQHLPFNDL